MAGARNTRTIGAVCAAPILAALIATPAALGQRAVSSTSQLEQSFLHSINGVRIDHRRPPVRLDRRLRETARTHSRDMVGRSYFAHGAFATRIEAAGAPGNLMGEVLGWIAESDRPVGALVLLWLDSPDHRAVLLDRRYLIAGVGVSQGEFEGYAGTIVVTADFEGWTGR